MHLSVRHSQINGETAVPGSKSHTIRALAIASLAKGPSIIKAPLVWLNQENWNDDPAPYSPRRTKAELEAEAVAARKEESRRAAIAALTAKDWALCAERCANCRASGGCLAGIAVPPDHRLNARPCSPAECPRFAAKEGGAA